MVLDQEISDQRVVIVPRNRLNIEVSVQYLTDNTFYEHILIIVF